VRRETDLSNDELHFFHEAIVRTSDYVDTVSPSVITQGYRTGIPFTCTLVMSSECTLRCKTVETDISNLRESFRLLIPPHRRYMNVVIHDGTAHADEMVALAILEGCGAQGAVTRSRDILPVDGSYDLFIDVGGKFDDCTFFDHHQKDFNETDEDGNKLSSAGLIWRKFGPLFCWRNSTWSSHKAMYCNIWSIIRRVGNKDFGRGKGSWLNKMIHYSRMDEIDVMEIDHPITRIIKDYLIKSTEELVTSTIIQATKAPFCVVRTYVRHWRNLNRKLAGIMFCWTNDDGEINVRLEIPKMKESNVDTYFPNRAFANSFMVRYADCGPATFKEIIRGLRRLGIDLLRWYHPIISRHGDSKHVKLFLDDKIVIGVKYNPEDPEYETIRG